jgi:thiosulfate/3-mercaptopyruvate sulfurtransferase
MPLALPPLVDVGTLSEHLHDPELRLFDISVRLLPAQGGGPNVVESGRVEYEREHIPGAAFADIPGELSVPHR